MQNFEHLLEEDFIIWNSELGVRDFVTIGEIDYKNNTAFLEYPFDMVGPFYLDELCKKGEISFASCIVLSKEMWLKKQKRFQEEAIKAQYKNQKDFQEEIRKYNNNRKKFQNDKNESYYRELLELPLDSNLNESIIKTAYRIIVKRVHPDVGGTHEKFIEITNARDALLKVRKCFK